MTAGARRSSSSSRSPSRTHSGRPSRSRCWCGCRRSPSWRCSPSRSSTRWMQASRVDIAPHVTGTTGTLSLDSVRVLDDAAASATIVGRHDHLRLLGGLARLIPGGLHGDRRDQRCHGNGAHHRAARGCAAAARNGARRRVRPSSARTRPSTSSPPSPIPRAACCCSATSSRRRMTERPSRSMRWARTHLRVSGSTATGAPGRLGTVSYMVSDGTDDQGAQRPG